MKLYIIPGLGESLDDYQWLVLSGEQRGYEVEFLPWQLPGNLLTEIINRPLVPGSTVFGFSVGALIAYKLTTPM